VESLRRFGMVATNIHQVLESSWPQDAPTLRHTQRLVKEFKDGDRVSFTRSVDQGRPRSEERQNAIRLIEEALEDDSCLSMRRLSSILNLTHGMVQRVLQEDLEIWMLSKWVPHGLTADNRLNRVEKCTTMLQAFSSRLVKNNLVVLDEKWFYFRKVSPRCNVGSWETPDGDRLQTPQRKTTEKKIMAIVAVTLHGIQYFKVLENNIDSNVYITFLREMVAYFSNQNPISIQPENDTAVG